MTISEFRMNLEAIINMGSMENGSNTPDFILAEYLSDCLEAFDKAVNRRSEWYGQDAKRTAEPDLPQPVRPID